MSFKPRYILIVILVILGLSAILFKENYQAFNLRYRKTSAPDLETSNKEIKDLSHSAQGISTDTNSIEKPREDISQIALSKTSKVYTPEDILRSDLICIKANDGIESNAEEDRQNGAKNFLLFAPHNYSADEYDLLNSLIVSGPLANNNFQFKLDSPESSFFSALALSQQLSPQLTKRTDYAKALQVLDGLIEDNSDNAALYYAKVYTQQQLNYPKEEILKTLNQLFKASTFDSYTLKISQLIYKGGYESTTAAVMAVGIASSIPIMDYAKTRQVIYDYLETEGRDYQQKALKFGEKLMQQHRANADKTESVFWFAIEYEIGRSIYKKAYAKLNAGKVPDVPNFKQIGHGYQIDQVDVLIKAFETCDRETLDSFFKNERLNFYKYYKK